MENAPSSVIASFGFNRTTIYRWLESGIEARCGTECAALSAGDGAAAQSDAAPGTAGVPLDQRP